MSVPRISGVQLSDPSAGPLLLLGTSIGTSAAALWSASAALLGERFHVVAWDLPGHGRNTEPVSAGFTMAELASGVLALADQVLTDRGEPGGIDPEDIEALQPGAQETLEAVASLMRPGFRACGVFLPLQIGIKQLVDN